jgi:beta-galactosidase
MKTRIFAISILVTLLGLLFQDCSRVKKETPLGKAILTEGRTSILFDAGWLFHRGDVENGEQAVFDDSSWRILDLPHDWSIEDIPGTNSPIDSTAMGGIDAGYLVGGTGWYRKAFMLPKDLAGKKFLLQFDGVYMNADVWLNGQHLGNHPYGYTTFRYDITSYLLPGKENVLAVQVKNEGRNSRWYSGSGIYRHVRLDVMEPMHLDPWQLFITTPQVDEKQAMVNIKTNVFNETSNAEEVTLVTRILNKAGVQLAQDETTQSVTAGTNVEFNQEIPLLSPELWSPENPNLYTAVSELSTVSEGLKKAMDRIEIPFGVRTVTIHAKDGFLLNGVPLELKGACMHHDNGPLGSAAYDRAEERRVELMKTNGYNAIRTAHNPPSPAFLDACDRLGILVIDEAFDMWREPKNPDDYHLYFDEWWQKDIESMVLRDRNHPSVVLWSIGNEIPERGKPEGAALAHQLADYIRQLDPTRKITSAVNNVTLDKDPYFAALDVCGYNYAIDNYVSDHKRLPDRVIVATESFPLEAYEYWMAVIDYPWVFGDFVWTGYDYLGEASIGWLGYPHEGSFFPWTHAYCGDIDICGFKRPPSYYRDVLWGDGKQLSIFVRPPVPTFPLNPKKETWSKWGWQDVVARWNWEGNEGTVLNIEVYCSCPEVELFLNQKSQGRKKTNRDSKWIATYQVPYEPGILNAKGYNGSTEIAACELKTAEEPVKITLAADHRSIKADGQDLSYVTVELLDVNGVRNPVASNMVRFEIEGPGTIVAVGSSNPMGTESFKQPYRNAYQGRCLVIVKSGYTPGDMILKASSDGLSPAEITISAGSNNL